jgi:chloramphenicol-sensitive protein RarD
MKMDEKRGVIFACLACILWGILPLYWKLVSFVPASEVLCHRIVWSAFLLILLVVLSGQLDSLTETIFTPKRLFTLFISAILIGINWLTFIWAVGNGHALEAGVGYFLSPVTTAAMGIVFLKEKISKRQFLMFCSASIGIFTLSFTSGDNPCISLVLAGTWSSYSLVRRLAKLDSLQALTVESIFLTPVAIIYLYFNWTPLLSISKQLLLFSAGPITVIPLLLFGAAVSKINLVTIGKIQYLTPTLQMIISVFLFKENFTTAHAFALTGIAVGTIINRKA